MATRGRCRPSYERERTTSTALKWVFTSGWLRFDIKAPQKEDIYTQENGKSIKEDKDFEWLQPSAR